jgi:sugar phosphate isomerase/epimerase
VAGAGSGEAGRLAPIGVQLYTVRDLLEKDFAGTSGPPDHRMTDVGAGRIPWTAIFAHREQAGIRHAFIEHDAPADPLASVKHGYEYLRRLDM